MLHYFDRTWMRQSLKIASHSSTTEFAVQLLSVNSNNHFKVHHLRTKHLLKEAARGIVPQKDHRQAEV